MSALVVVFPRGQLSQKDKERLTKHGIVAVEADDPKQVRMLSLEVSGVESSEILRCTLAALSSGATEDKFGNITEAGRQKAKFVEHMAKATEAKP